MTFEARLAFLLGFFAIWMFLGMLPWLLVAIVRHGRGVIFALPLALAGGAAGGVLAPALGADDARGFLLSLAAAAGGGLLASLIGVLLTKGLRRF
ncbi:MAG TPA: hypothetical protein VFB90_03110 [Dehalococcoidia bacterium]|nr:hypothetical protein [Dehalococcoidia bacterium]